MKINYHFLDQGHDFSYHDQRRSEFQSIYANYLAAEPALKRHVLDIGCGHGTNPTIAMISDHLGDVDGVDPFPVQMPHPLIKNRWTCSLEDLPVAPGSYDMAYSYNVVEHVSEVDSFLHKVVEVLRPGGVYWSMSPNLYHPFSICVLILQAIHLKGLYRKNLAPLANDYPAHYRMCSDKKILSAIKRQNISIKQIDFYYVHCVQWDSFFPKKLRFIANFIDKLFILKHPKTASIFMFRLQRED
jgi:2-polyprenyl-3-methyl-5-hydroxy-6-metoxy-1,4-benzoquinol methylase